MKHALLSASAAHRWLLCPRSARATENLISKSSKYSQTGTWAHEVAEVTLRYYLNMISVEEYTPGIEKLKDSEYWTVENYDYVENYIAYILEQANGAEFKLIEKHVDFSKYVPEGFGTADAIIVKDGILHVIDLKFGMGVPVSAESNPQLRLYALGALELFEGIKGVKMHIVQVRRNHLSTEELSVDELVEWAKAEVVPKAKLAYNGKGEFKAGNHCKFCPLGVTCVERANYNLRFASYDFKAPEVLTDEDILDIIDGAEELNNWVKSIQAYALEKAIEGKKLERYELAIRPGKRTFKDEKEVAKILYIQNYALEEIMDLKGITALEKIVGKKQLDMLVGEYIVRNEGSYYLKKSSPKK